MFSPVTLVIPVRNATKPIVGLLRYENKLSCMHAMTHGGHTHPDVQPCWMLTYPRVFSSKASLAKTLLFSHPLRLERTRKPSAVPKRVFPPWLCMTVVYMRRNRIEVMFGAGLSCKSVSQQ